LSNDKDDLPTAVVVQDGKVPGDVPSSAPPPGPAPKSRYKRKLSNYLLDKTLQLRYTVLVTVLSAIITTVLGTMIYRQMRIASESALENVASLTDDADADDDLKQSISDDMQSRDRKLILEMAAAGVGLVIILSGYLILMTHKVAGPLYKVSMYFDKMSAGKMGNVTPLRRGDMLTDFYDGFREMHVAVRSRLQQDASAMQKLVDACKAAGVDSEAIDKLGEHVEARKKALA
jgi:hypothetical protein